MDPAQEALFGGFPRRVGTPNQFWVFNRGQFDLFTETINGSRGAYATVSRLPLDGREVCDKVLFDLDGPKDRVFADDMAADERISAMRHDPDAAEAVLGEVCEETQQLARASRDDGIPVLGVFSGFGIHLHQLYRSTEDPQVAMTTCAARYIDRLDLQTADWKVVGDPQRICRIPNVERATFRTDETGRIVDGVGTGLYTVPLSGRELCSVTPEWLMEVSHSPRVPSPLTDNTRPQMPVWEDYRESTKSEAADQPQRPVDSRTAPLSDDGLEALLEDLLRMPCMVDRITQPNPEHEVRLNCAVLLFNTGLNPQQVANIYERLGWVDFDRGVTETHLKHIYKNGYADMNCKTIRREGLCTRAEEPGGCPTFGWSGGEAEWKAQT